MSTPKDLSDLTEAMKLISPVLEYAEVEGCLPRQMRLDLVSAQAYLAATHSRLQSEQTAQKKADKITDRIIYPKD